MVVSDDSRMDVPLMPAANNNHEEESLYHTECGVMDGWARVLCPAAILAMAAGGGAVIVLPKIFVKDRKETKGAGVEISPKFSQQ